ncbi:hypothetical protein AALP_AA5G207800 [Arabis alpina]|uniref:Uncharacterized protein n=1 Tax=Arabis alpina TaxID=50452 RepID=A0A087GYE6_ARAAL|nr:hypothetical protein AALP_AA5G207800 [Arabis alpina]
MQVTETTEPSNDPLQHLTDPKIDRGRLRACLLRNQGYRGTNL